MQDDFDSGMGMPDDELAGGSAMSDMGEAGHGGAEGEGEGGGEPAGRPSGGARARKSSGSRKSSSARKGVAKPKKAVKKAAPKKAKAKKPARKAAGKSGKKAKKVFEAHAVDAWVSAASVSGAAAPTCKRLWYMGLILHIGDSCTA